MIFHVTISERTDAFQWIGATLVNSHFLKSVRLQIVFSFSVESVNADKKG